MKTFLRAQWDRVAAVIAVIAGLVALVLGWIGVSGTDKVAEQIPFVISGGITGLALIVLGAALWLSADIRDEWRKLDRIAGELSPGTGSESAITAEYIEKTVASVQ